MPNLVEAMVTAGAIESATVTFIADLTADELSSTMTLGSSTVADGVASGPMASLMTSETQPWKISGTTITLGDSSSTVSASISTGAPFIYLTSDLFTAF